MPAQEGWVPGKCLDMMYVNRNDSYVSLHTALSSHSITSFCSQQQAPSALAIHGDHSV